MIPFKNKVETRIESVIPTAAITSDNDISSFKTEFPKQSKKNSARSSDFCDHHSWADRVHSKPLLNIH